MDPQPASPRTELDLMTEQDLARHLKICRRQLYSWRMATFKEAQAFLAIKFGSAA